jgi:DNA segregation ATPase FtsK/SpoIIIE, S-DNA-T family
MWHQLRLFLRNRLLDLLGLALLGASGTALLALFSYHSQDPSLNTAAPGEPANWMGAEGAIFADLGLQLFGLGILAIVIPVGVFGTWCLRKQHPPFLWVRGAFWIVGVLAAAALAHHLSYVLKSLTEKVTASIPAGWGGVVGSTLADGLSQSLVLLKLVGEGTAQAASGGAFLALLLIGLTFALGLRLRHIRETYDSMRTGVAYAGAAMGNAARFAGRFVPGEPEPARAGAGGPMRSTLRDTADTLGSGEKTAPRITIEPAVPRETRDSRAEAKAEERARARAEKETRREERRAARKEDSTAVSASFTEIRGLAVEPANFTLPPLNLLARPSAKDRTERVADRVLEERARKLEGVLQDFGVSGQILNVRPGPVITLYEFEPAPGIKSSRVIGLADDIARSMSAVSARVAVIPGRNAIGIELPNKKRETVYLRELLASEDFETDRGRLNLALGKTIDGEPVIGDLSEMPHLLIAGTTGSGKSVAINTMILSLLYKLTPAQCRLILIDPKMLELSVYDGIPHLLTPVVTEPKKAVVALKWIVREMEDRYRMMSKLGVRNIHGYNEKVSEALAKGQKLTRRVQTGFDKKTGAPKYEREQFAPEAMPFIVVVVDEMADLMMVAGKDIEGAVQRLAQMARAAGIHLITATQRPSVDVITGTIKANFPTRISFQVTSKIDSRTILGEQGAEHLLGKGDMLYMPGGGRISRLHGPFVTDEEVEAVVANLKKQGAPEYIAEVTEEPAEDPLADLLGGGNGGPGDDDFYDKAVAIVARDRKASTSYIQRKLQIGYNRAARIVDRMEEEGVVSQPNHAGKREVLVGDHGFD